MSSITDCNGLDAPSGRCAGAGVDAPLETGAWASVSVVRFRLEGEGNGDGDGETGAGAEAGVGVGVCTSVEAGAGAERSVDGVRVPLAAAMMTAGGRTGRGCSRCGSDGRGRRATRTRTRGGRAGGV